MPQNQKSLTSILPVYIDSYELLKYMLVLIKNMPRDVKFIYGMDLKNQSFLLVANIYFATVSKNDKINYINSALSNIKFINLMIRVTKDLNFVKDKQYYGTINLTGKINKQLKAWKYSIVDRQNNNR